MSYFRDWKGQLADILERHNEMHAFRNKPISHSTREARRHALFRMFGLLRQLGFMVAPDHIADRHVQVLVRYWCGLPVAGRPAREHPCSAAYIQQQLSILRVFAGWIGKAGLVREAEAYVDEPALVSRHYPAQRDCSWTANGVDAQALVVKVTAIDRYVGIQLRLMLAFGMRRKEAVMFAPHVAEVPYYALPKDHPAATRFVSFLRIKHGTKGGHLRYTAVRSDEQREALEEARRVARTKGGHVGCPGLTLKQSLDRFSNVVRTVGITRKGLGVTAHGLRHQFANDLYFEIAKVRSPVRGGDPALDPAVRRDAYRQVAEQLGHHRPQISTAYLGSLRRKGGAGNEERAQHQG
jgi:hypothetical protein